MQVASNYNVILVTLLAFFSFSAKQSQINDVLSIHDFSYEQKHGQKFTLNHFLRSFYVPGFIFLIGILFRTDGGNEYWSGSPLC